jgi:hypothetical protein
MLKRMYSTILFITILLLFSVYSWSFVDLNFTLFSSTYWTIFRDSVIQLSYFHRDISLYVYISLVVAIFILYISMIKNARYFYPLLIAISISSFISYPFLSHDFFNYIFDAKILTFYHMNPYQYTPIYFADDTMLRFMHWTHRTYPYGPSFLLITLIPSLLSFGKFIISFYLFKLVWIGFFIYAAHVLYRYNKLMGFAFATNPFVIIEGLYNMHNDIIALCLGIIAVCIYLEKKKLTFKSLAMVILSVGIKYMSVFSAVLFIPRLQRYTQIIFYFLTGAIIIYVALHGDLQPWYFLNFFLIIPLYKKLPMAFNIMTVFLLLSYCTYIVLGNWQEANAHIFSKNNIILLGVILSIAYTIIHNTLYAHKKYNN